MYLSKVYMFNAVKRASTIQYNPQPLNLHMLRMVTYTIQEGDGF